MQDIDFDEIDRAVNSHNNPNKTVKSVEPSFAVPTQNDTAPVVSEPVTETPIVAATPAPSPAVRRSSGRFMDVVHPSSDMRPAMLTRSSAPSAPSLHREEAPAQEAVASRPEPAAVSSAAFHWPDPIDVLDTAPASTPDPVTELIESLEPSKSEPAAEVVEEPPVVETPADLDDDSEDDLDDDLSDDFDDEDEEAAPLESPFLVDAKVEKRPLGAFSGADSDLPLLEDPLPFHTSLAPAPAAAPEVIDEDEPAAVDSSEPEVVELAHEEHEETPDELHEDLLKLEGHGADEDDELLLEATNPPDPEPITVQDDVPTGPTSITQQYKEQPSSTAESSGSIFDTEAYHQPLTHATNKRSGALVAVWIAALVLVGAGIGAAIYFVVLPMLG